ncbi:putative sodium-dependent multivitamin transporter isoform X2 [Oratosquilla oratoria]
MLADQSMSVLPVAFSLMASFMSAITLLGVSKENYMFGTQFITINLAYIISTPIVCYMYLPVFFRLQKSSVYEYLEERFGRVTRVAASLAFSLQMTLYMGIVLFAPALALSAVTGISQTWSIVAVGVVCTFYSSLGGMKAVLVTDVFQSILMFVAVYAVITKGLYDQGIKDIFRIASEGERIEFFNISPDPRERHTIWSLGIGGIFTYCSLYGVNQAQVQRLLTLRSLERAQAALWIQWPILTVLSLSTSFAGLVLYAHYHGCDPLKSHMITNTDQLLPLYVVETMGNLPGVAGLFVSGIFSGSLSTVSSALNSLAAVTVQDYIGPLLKKNGPLTDTSSTRLSKVLVIIYGVICIGIAFLTQFAGTGVLQASLTIFGAVGGPLLAIFTLGMICCRANQKGAMSGLIVGLIFTMWIGFGKPKPPPPVKPTSVEKCLSNATDGLEGNGTLVFATDAPVTEVLIMNDLMNETSVFTNHTIVDNMERDERRSFLHNLYAVSYMWIGAIGFFITFVLGFVVSLATGGNRIHKEELYATFLTKARNEMAEEDLIKEHNANRVDLSPLTEMLSVVDEDAEVTHM